MTFSDPRSDIHVPGGAWPAVEALARVTHLCVVAHQDDIEFMAHAGIVDCLETPGKHFGGVVVTDGAGSSRTGPYAAMTDDEMREVRKREQRKAADLGGYAIQIQLSHPSSRVKQPGHAGVAMDLDAIFAGCRPEVVYLHNPADKHDTHVAVLARCLEALRRLPAGARPGRVLGCEGWRDLDWLPDDLKVALDSGRQPELAERLAACFDSQISGGKRYDRAVAGRRAANATFHNPHATDVYSGITWAVDLTPLMTDATRSLEAFTVGLVDALRMDVADRIRRLT